MAISKSILLIEDDKDDQEFFIEALTGIKNAVLYYVANNGKEAIDKLKDSVVLPDLIFSDINMPIMNGIDCLTEIIKNNDTKNIPVVILTTDTGRKELVRELGAKAFIKKPAAGKLLRHKLEEMINLDFIIDSHIANKTFQNEFSTGGQMWY